MSIKKMEDLAGELATTLEGMEGPQSAEEAQSVARTLAIMNLGVAETLKASLEAWTLKNGPVFIDDAQDQAYGQWEKTTTMVGDESGLWAFLLEQGVDINNHKRPDLVTLKALLTGEEPIEGLERFVGTSTSYSFGIKKNLLKRPRASAKPSGETAMVAKPKYVLGPRGVVNKAKFIKYTPKNDVPVEPVCGVMPPERIKVLTPA
jgi:hypothetical protein